MKKIISGLAIYSSLFPLYMYILFYEQQGKIDFNIPYEPGLISFLFFGFFALVVSLLLAVISLGRKRELGRVTYAIVGFSVIVYAILAIDPRDVVGIVLD